MSRDPKANIELKAGYLLPALFIVGALVNFGVSGSLSPNFDRFAEVSFQALGVANYSQDPFELSFPPVDADIIEDALGTQASQNVDGQAAGSGSAQATPTPGTAAQTPTPGPMNLPTVVVPPIDLTSLPALPTLPAVVQTVLPVLPTLPAILPTLPSILPFP